MSVPPAEFVRSGIRHDRTAHATKLKSRTAIPVIRRMTPSSCIFAAYTERPVDRPHLYFRGKLLPQVQQLQQQDTARDIPLAEPLRHFRFSVGANVTFTSR